MAITFPTDPPVVDTQAVADVGGAEKYGTIDGTYVSVLNVGAASITSLNADVINAGTLSAARIAAGSLNADKIQSNTITATQINTGYVYAGTITASQLISGTIVVGGTNQPTAITINESSLSGNARLGWQHGSRLWEDSSSNMGINAIGGTFIIYTDSDEIARFSDVFQIKGDALYFNLAAPVGFSVRDRGLLSWHDTTGGRDRNVLQWGNGTTFGVDSSGSWFHVNGNDKSAIVPTSKGYNALYCIESPEVWFMDFCEGTRVLNTFSGWKFWKWFLDWKVKPDPMFLETTEAPFVIMPTGKKGIIQIWGKRRGHAGKRFESKTREEYDKNEEFLSMAKIK